LEVFIAVRELPARCDKKREREREKHNSYLEQCFEEKSEQIYRTSISELSIKE
jgi:hypothetical protein